MWNDGGELKFFVCRGDRGREDELKGGRGVERWSGGVGSGAKRRGGELEIDRFSVALLCVELRRPQGLGFEDSGFVCVSCPFRWW